MKKILVIFLILFLSIVGHCYVMYELYLPEVSGTGNPAGTDKVFTAVNCSGLTKANGYLKIDLKCDTPANMSTIGALELTSSGIPDVNEWTMVDLTGLGITTDYQTFYIPLADWGTTSGELNVAAINFIRWYNFSTDGNITIYWRNAYIIIGWLHEWNTQTISKLNMKEFTKWNGLR